LAALVEPLLIVRRALCEHIVILHRRLLAIVRDDESGRFGLTCSKYQSGEIDWSGRISRCGEFSNHYVPHSTERSVLVDINWHGVPPDRKILETQWSIECSDMQKDYRPRVVK
jgi:transposase